MRHIHGGGLCRVFQTLFAGMMLVVPNAVALASTNSPIDQWPASPRPSTAPLTFDKWAGPYMNAAGQKWVDQINAWYSAGTAGGVWQDAYRSYDNNHSNSFRTQMFPQMTIVSAVGDVDASSITSLAYDPRVTFGVQSYGDLGTANFDHYSVAMYASNMRYNARGWYTSGSTTGGIPMSWYQGMSENNFYFVRPACEDWQTSTGDKFDYYTPYVIHSIGFSGSDGILLKIFTTAVAAIPPDIKTRMLRNGVYVPTIMWLLKNNYTSGGLHDPAAHVMAYTLPAESADNATGPSPFIDDMVTMAHNLQHIPPVAKITVESAVVNVATGVSYSRGAYMNATPGEWFGALRYGETLVLTINLTSSWKDTGQSLTSYYSAKLRGWGTIEYLSADKSRMKITIPWTNVGRNYDYRTDILLLVSDGMYESAPAYVSVRHIQSTDTGYFGISNYPALTPLDPDDQMDEADALNVIQVGSTVTGKTIDIATDVDLFHFTATAGQQVTFALTGALSGRIRVFDSLGNQLATGTSSAQCTFAAAGTYYVGVSGAGNAAYEIVGGNGDANGTTGAYTLTLTDTSVPQITVAGCYVFYNNSKFDGNNPAAGTADDTAIATDKTPLLPGHTASFANYTGYNRGINGMMVDIPGVANVTASDFTFKVGNSNTPSSWMSVTNPTITLRAGAGISGSSRITLVWADGRIVGKWLQITVKATANTGLTSDATFYFGNAPGEMGNSASSARVDAADVTATRNDPHKTFANPAGITDPCDFNRDGKVNVADEVISRQSVTTITSELKLISVP